MQANSAPVVSNQSGPHPDLQKRVLKHANGVYRQPFKAFNQKSFYELQSIIETSGLPLILDSGCGNGTSTEALADRFPDCLVIGIDKSQHRLEHCLGRLTLYHQANLVLLRADLVDIWRLAAQADWRLQRHYFLYPNPWPKKKHLGRRWYAHPVLTHILRLGGRLECRSNWGIYIDEFAIALRTLGRIPESCQTINPSEYLTPFERKYHQSGHALFRLVCDLERKD